MDDSPLTLHEKQFLLQVARTTLEQHFGIQSNLPEVDSTPQLREMGATFVTLIKNGELRGCVGALEAYQPLIEDVREHTIAAAFHDYRFPPLEVEELKLLKIEISRLTPPVPLAVDHPANLENLITPFQDGVILQYGRQRATFLPQVWEKLPNPNDFLSHLCQKMGVDPYMWRYKKMEVYTYRVEEFHE